MVEDNTMLEFFDALIKEIEKTSDFRACYNQQILDQVLGFVFTYLYEPSVTTNLEDSEVLLYDKHTGMFLLLDIYQNENYIMLDIDYFSKEILKTDPVLSFMGTGWFLETIVIEEWAPVKNVAYDILKLLDRVSSQLY